MTKARKIILLVAATWIIYLILFPPAQGLLYVKNGHILNEPIPWDEVVLIAVAAVVALLITKIPNPGGKE
jgi:hypothetical protein